MIEYLYSRILVTLASVAIAGLIIAVSASSSQVMIRDLANEIAEQFVQLISTATSINCEYFSADFFATNLPFSLDARLIVRAQMICVSIGDYRAVGIFEHAVGLSSGNGTVDAFEFHSSTHGIRVESERDFFKKVNSVTLHLIEISGYREIASIASA
ncbi:MAG: hypothetical protein QW505_06165, partial [Thermoplasmata archaeon]